MPVIPKQTRRKAFLTEQAGMGLVMFHLGRLNFEFIPTQFNSPNGDLWVQLSDRKVSLEVKSTFDQKAWHVPRKQIPSSDFYCLVHVLHGVVFVLTTQEVVEIAAESKNCYDGVALIKAEKVPHVSLNAWHKLGTSRAEADFRPELPGGYRPKITRYSQVGKMKIVHKTLKNGTVKIYEYPPDYVPVALRKNLVVMPPT